MKCCPNQWKVHLTLLAFIILLTLPLSKVDAQQQVVNSLGMKQRLIPAGHYVRGRMANHGADFKKDHTSNVRADEDPAHPVRLTKPFYIGTTEVTVGQFHKFVEATGYRTTAEKGENQAVGFKPITHRNRLYFKQPFNRGEEFTWKSPGFEQTDSHPVVCISWHDAQTFCRWLSQTEDVTYRLPTEAEWEYACRAGTTSSFNWGNKYRRFIHQKANVGNVELEKAHEDLARRHWFVDVENDPGDGHVYTAPVGSFPANAWDLHDMHGNVWEWCQDTYLDTLYQQYRSTKYPLPHTTAVDPLNEKPWNEFGDWRLMRGGSWYTPPMSVRSESRGYFDAPDSACYLGFRIVRDAPPEVMAEAQTEWEKEQAAIAKLHEWISEFYASGNMVGRAARFNRNSPPADVTQDLYRISSLNGVYARDVDASFLQNVSKITALKHLEVDHLPKLADSDLAPLANLSLLEGVVLSGQSRLTNDCLEHLLGLTKLKRLQLSGEGITDEGLSRFRQLKNLEDLNLRETKTQGAILTSLGEIPLKKLELPDLSDEHAMRLADLSQLESFQCSGPSLTQRGFAHFAKLKWLTNLILRDCQGISSSGFGPLASLTKLKSLGLRGTQAGDDAMRQLARHYELQALSVDSENLTDLGMLDICGVISLQTLTIAAPAKITDEGLRDFWRLQRLRILFLEVDGLTGEGFSTLAEARSLDQLTIGSSALTDTALDHISAIPKLRYLTLNGNSSALTNKGLMMLAEAENLIGLTITLSGTQITDEAIERLKQAKPELKVEVRG